VLRIQRDSGRLLPGKCHESNMTRPDLTVKGNRVLPTAGRVCGAFVTQIRTEHA
jgi:hypothetical protein